MKKLIAMALCFALSACIIVGCGRNEGNRTTDTTKTPTTITTHTTNSVTPNTENTIPSISSSSPETSQGSSMPGVDNDNMGEGADNNRARSHNRIPNISGGNR